MNFHKLTSSKSLISIILALLFIGGGVYYFRSSGEADTAPPSLSPKIDQAIYQGLIKQDVQFAYGRKQFIGFNQQDKDKFAANKSAWDRGGNDPKEKFVHKAVNDENSPGYNGGFVLTYADDHRTFAEIAERIDPEAGAFAIATWSNDDEEWKIAENNLFYSTSGLKHIKLEEFATEKVKKGQVVYVWTLSEGRDIEIWDMKETKAKAQAGTVSDFDICSSQKGWVNFAADRNDIYTLVKPCLDRIKQLYIYKGPAPDAYEQIYSRNNTTRNEDYLRTFSSSNSYVLWAQFDEDVEVAIECVLQKEPKKAVEDFLENVANKNFSALLDDLPPSYVQMLDQRYKTDIAPSIDAFDVSRFSAYADTTNAFSEKLSIVGSFEAGVDAARNQDRKDLIDTMIEVIDRSLANQNITIPEDIVIFEEAFTELKDSLTPQELTANASLVNELEESIMTEKFIILLALVEDLQDAGNLSRGNTLAVLEVMEELAKNPIVTQTLGVYVTVFDNIDVYLASEDPDLTNKSFQILVLEKIKDKNDKCYWIPAHDYENTIFPQYKKMRDANGAYGTVLGTLSRSSDAALKELGLALIAKNNTRIGYRAELIEFIKYGRTTEARYGSLETTYFGETDTAISNISDATLKAELQGLVTTIKAEEEKYRQELITFFASTENDPNRVKLILAREMVKYIIKGNIFNETITPEINPINFEAEPYFEIGPYVRELPEEGPEPIEYQIYQEVVPEIQLSPRFQF